MDETQQHLKNISEIRSIMERSSSFISLSGLGGVFAGIFAIAGAAFAYFYLYVAHHVKYTNFIIHKSDIDTEISRVLFADAIIVLICALLFSYIFTRRNAKSKNLKVWNKTAKLMLINLLIPLISGGIFIIIMLWHGAVYLFFGATLIFYGLALLNASKYTHKDIRLLGITEIIIGLIAALDYHSGLLYWALGFGVMHIVYGTLMYFKYERKKSN